MPELFTRPATADDAGAIADFMNMLERASGGEDGWSETEVRGFFGTMIIKPELDTRLRLAPDGSIVAFATVQPPEVGNTLAYAHGGVHPDWRGRGIGREEFGWQIERLKEWYADRAPAEEWEIDAGANVADPSAIRMFERFGLKSIRFYIDMIANTADARPEPLVDGVRVTPYTVDLRDRLHAAHQVVWRDYWGYQPTPLDRWTARTVEAETFRPDLSRIVFAGDEIVAYVLSHDGIPGQVYISHVGTRREWRRKGIAGALLGDVLTQARDLGFRTASLGADADSPTGAVGVYERAGFRVHSTFAAYRRKL
jgi:mycothiol synthase